MVRIKCLEIKLRKREYYPPFTFYANCHINFYAPILLLFGLYFTLGRENFLRYILVGVSTDVLRSTKKYLSWLCTLNKMYCCALQIAFLCTPSDLFL